MTTGTFNIDDLRAVKYASAMEFGLDKIAEVLNADLSFYNNQVTEQMRFLAEPVTEQARIWGTSATIPFTEIDEYGQPVSKKTSVGETSAFPLKIFSAGLGWTEQYLRMATPAEMAEAYLQIRRGHAENLLEQMKKAVFNKDNYTAIDPFNKVSLAVKRLLNSDGSKIPEFAGTKFTGSSHTHYLAKAGTDLAVADIDKAIETVIEHGMTHGVKVFINVAQKATVAGLSKFKALDSALLAYNGVTSTIEKLDLSDFSNQMVGYWDNSFEIWVKPFIPANYILVAATEEVEKVLGYRQLATPSMQGLRIAAQYSQFPLVAQTAESVFGFGIWNRMAASCLYVGGTTWANA